MKFTMITIKWSNLIYLMPLLVIISCHPDKTTNIPDVSDIHVDLKVTRFEQLLLGDTAMDAIKLQKLMDDYPAFSKVYFDHVMPMEDDIIVNTDRETRLK
ncbi:MAG: hypothetical protein WBB31_03490, partial [Saprospiraceae bacterium]